jgi:hypothetical protein
MQLWLEEFITKQPHSLDIVMDGDLPKKDWFEESQSPLLSEGSPGEFHTVVPGRPIGLHPHTVVELAAQKIHLHFYGDFTHGQWKQWIEKTNLMAPGYLHIHANVDQENWVREFSQYDAGWLHFFKSENQGEINRANWDDLNIPARMATLAIAGVPMLQRNNDGHVVATQSAVKKLGIGLLFNDMQELGNCMRDRESMKRLRQNTWKQRHLFMFDYHVKGLEMFFRQVIENHRNKSKGKTGLSKTFFPPIVEKAVADHTRHPLPRPF